MRVYSPSSPGGLCESVSPSSPGGLCESSIRHRLVGCVRV